jgi:ribonuclease BN (tRNA processing enzyme)
MVPVKSLKVQFLGCGDAFGSGGRLQTCIFVDACSTKFLIDCGTTALIGMKRFGVDPSNIDVILLSHLHGDHFGGIPFIIRETQIIAERTTPLTIAGPCGTEQRIKEAMKIFFPGSTDIKTQFPLDFIELPENESLPVGSLVVSSYPALHTAGTNPLSLRLECNGCVISYSGDTQWNDSLIEAARGADLFICEAFEYDREMKNHTDYMTLLRHLDKLDCRRIVLTHMSDSMLNRCDTLDLECAEDGKIIMV